MGRGRVNDDEGQDDDVIDVDEAPGEGDESADDHAERNIEDEIDRSPWKYRAPEALVAIGYVGAVATGICLVGLWALLVAFLAMLAFGLWI